MWSAGSPTEFNERGFTYPLVLVAIVVLAIAANTASVVVSREVRAAKEKELLFRGMAYQRAIASYYRAGEGRNELPRRLEDLAKDPRFAHRRHIRRLYDHPLDERDWVVIRGPSGGIRGVASPSQETPLKQAHFPAPLSAFEGAKRYRDWVFAFQPFGEKAGPAAPRLSPFASPASPAAPRRLPVGGGYGALR